MPLTSTLHRHQEYQIPLQPVSRCPGSVCTTQLPICTLSLIYPHEILSVVGSKCSLSNKKKVYPKEPLFFVCFAHDYLKQRSRSYVTLKSFVGRTTVSTASEYEQILPKVKSVDFVHIQCIRR